MNPLNNPAIAYLRVVIGYRVARARAADRSLGVSAIEWAIITGLLSIIALAIGATIWNAVEDAGGNIETDPGDIGE